MQCYTCFHPNNAHFLATVQSLALADKRLHQFVNKDPARALLKVFQSETQMSMHAL